MSVKSFYKVLVKVLGDDLCTFAVDKTSYGFQITYGKQYTPPALDLNVLLCLSELFGTKKIDVDHYSEKGCPTCDHGSDYGHTLQVYNPSRSVEELTGLVGCNRETIDKKTSESPELEAWYSKLRDNPDDADLHLVFSDWLEDQNKHEYANWHRSVASMIKGRSTNVQT